MGSRTREQRIIAAVPCPECGAAVGELCRQRRELLQRERGRPILHTARRIDWQEWKKGKGEAK